MCAAVRRMSSLDPASWCSMPSSHRTSYRFNLSLDLLPSVAKILSEYQPFVTEIITKYKALFFGVYNTSCRVQWLNTVKRPCVLAWTSWWPPWKCMSRIFGGRCPCKTSFPYSCLLKMYVVFFTTKTVAHICAVIHQQSVQAESVFLWLCRDNSSCVRAINLLHCAPNMSMRL